MRVNLKGRDMASIAALGIFSPGSPLWGATSKLYMTGGDVEDEAALAWFWKSDEKDFFSVFDGGGEGAGGDGGSDDPPSRKRRPQPAFLEDGQSKSGCLQAQCGNNSKLVA